MEKIIKAYSQISCFITLSICIYADVLYLRIYFSNGYDENIGWHDNISGNIIAVTYLFTLINGILLIIAGVYLVQKKIRQLGWASIIISLMFYSTVLYIYFTDRPPA
jgi:hypothetical protein